MNRFINFFIASFLMLFAFSVEASEGGFDLSGIVSDIMSKYPTVNYIALGISTLLVLAQIIVALTPSKKDDKKLKEIRSKSFVKPIWNFFLSRAPIQKKNGKLKLSKDDD